MLTCQVFWSMAASRLLLGYFIQWVLAYNLN